MSKKFLVIDDSELDGYIAQKKIENRGEDVEVILFKDAEKALNYITSDGVNSDNNLTVVLLDILMPLMDGYGFMERYERLNEAIKQSHIVIAITSSMYKNQINKIYAYKSVKGVLEKPFTIEELNRIIGTANQEYIL